VRKYADCLSGRAALLALALLAGGSGWASELPRSGLELDQALARVQQRYQGRVIDAELKSAKPRDAGAVAVYEVRLLTPAGNVLKIRIDAADGRFLEVDGRGLVEARRP
jgi:hypothetical protein